MKRISILLCCILSFVSCKQKGPEVKTIEVTVPQEIVLNTEALVKSELQITGMTCAIGCAASIEKKLNSTPGVQSATVSFESELAQIVFDPNWIQDQELSTVVQSVGPVYKVTKNERVDVFSDLKTD
ncbi:MAG: heavy-metal-associated domain-containing protein [Flavobacteriaceae bacterium]|jgi:mercuric ion binding protein|nr:heavy-metal-associated domain-containing protein [Candidatus Arcticimaribacter sp.]